MIEYEELVAGPLACPAAWCMHETSTPRPKAASASVSPGDALVVFVVVPHQGFAFLIVFKRTTSSMKGMTFRQSATGQSPEHKDRCLAPVVEPFGGTSVQCIYWDISHAHHA
ncbi:hypothetical protein [Nitratireductor sp. ZSWI3]|uniref:hypothetical protein n=1 Tax=Nitratireductor sp. ZSWI3 TaxID=2966359 RepID=UPI002150353D|nr:hypothetical protein [Nitratireductor sp. ZSWI3]MCR4264768.1 hypothetical protein [Nitratireductor sp. ZSWI3]